MGLIRVVRAPFRSLAHALACALAPLAGVTALLAAPTVAMADTTHVIGKGHTLATIAGRYHVSTRAILDANPSLNPKRLRIGDTITIPGVGGGAAGGAAGAKSASAKASEKAPPTRGEGQAKAGPAGKPAAVAPAPAAAPAPARPGAHGKDPYAGKPKHPNTVQLVRYGTNEEVTVHVSAGGKVPHAALDKFKKIMHSSTGQTHTPDARLVALLGIVSNHFGGKKLEVVSGFRPYSPKQYTPHSNHNHGKAMDFRVQGVPNTVVRDFCRTLHDVGVGYYPNSVFVHLDVRSSPAFWIDYSKPGEAPRYQTPNADADEGASDVHAEHPTLNTAPAEGPGGSAAPEAPGAAPAGVAPAGVAPAGVAPGAVAPATPAPAVPAAPKGPTLPTPSPGAPSK